MDFPVEQSHFSRFISLKGIRQSKPRSEILSVFLSCEEHLTAGELAERVHLVYPKIGVATVYRTLKLIEEAGIARSIDLGDSQIRYEHHFAHTHHDHLVCEKCGRCVEVENPTIEAEQIRVAEQNGFTLTNHHLVLQGICADCRNGHQKRVLSALLQGEEGIISAVGGSGLFRKRLLEMGFIKGSSIKVVKYAPLKDPLEVIVRGTHISLRIIEAEEITVDMVEPGQS